MEEKERVAHYCLRNHGSVVLIYECGEKFWDMWKKTGSSLDCKTDQKFAEFTASLCPSHFFDSSLL